MFELEQLKVENEVIKKLIYMLFETKSNEIVLQRKSKLALNAFDENQKKTSAISKMNLRLEKLCATFSPLYRL